MPIIKLVQLLSLNLQVGEILRSAETNDRQYAVSIEKQHRAELEWWKTIALLSPKLSGQFTGSEQSGNFFSPMDALGFDDNFMFPTENSTPVILQPLYDWNGTSIFQYPFFKRIHLLTEACIPRTYPHTTKQIDRKYP